MGPESCEGDVKALLELVGGCQALLDVEDFRAGVLPLVREAVPCVVATYNEIEPESGRAFVLVDPPGAMDFAGDLSALLARVGSSNPLIADHARTRDGRARKVSEFLTRDELHETALWREAFRPLGIEHQIAFALPSQPSVVIGIALNRAERDFSERDRRLLDLARPLLVQAYRSAQIHTEMRRRLRALERGQEAAGQAVVALRPDGRIDAASRSAGKLLASAFGAQASGARQLPRALAEWVEQRRSAHDAVPLVLSAGEAPLVVRFVAGRSGAEPDVLLLEARADPIAVSSLRALGLSARESEVLRLAALGESRHEIAARLSISAATVKKHLENVYAKLGVHSRAEAVATAWAGAETKAMLGSEA